MRGAGGGAGALNLALLALLAGLVALAWAVREGGGGVAGPAGAGPGGRLLDGSRALAALATAGGARLAFPGGGGVPVTEGSDIPCDPDKTKRWLAGLAGLAVQAEVPPGDVEAAGGRTGFLGEEPPGVVLRFEDGGSLALSLGGRAPFGDGFYVGIDDGGGGGERIVLVRDPAPGGIYLAGEREALPWRRARRAFAAGEDFFCPEPADEVDGAAPAG